MEQQLDVGKTYLVNSQRTGAMTIKEIEKYLRQLAPHQQERQAACLLKDAVEELHSQQAKIDSLVLEFCSDEMIPEQTAEWERHQQAVHNI